MKPHLMIMFANFDHPMISFNFSVRKGKSIYFDGIESLFTYENYNLKNRWNSFCMSFDFEVDNWKLYINGNGNLTYLNKKFKYSN